MVNTYEPCEEGTQLELSAGKSLEESVSHPIINK